MQLIPRQPPAIPIQCREKAPDQQIGRVRQQFAQILLLPIRVVDIGHQQTNIPMLVHVIQQGRNHMGAKTDIRIEDQMVFHTVRHRLTDRDIMRRTETGIVRKMDVTRAEFARNRSQCILRRIINEMQRYLQLRRRHVAQQVCDLGRIILVTDYGETDVLRTGYRYA